MGYWVETMDVDFSIKKENLEKAYEALCELNKHDNLKHGRTGLTSKLEHSTSVAENPGVCFSWMDWNYDEIFETAQEIFEELGFETILNADGDLEVHHYNSKTGSEEDFLSAVAPFAKDGSYIEWRGEDGSMWRNFFESGVMTTQHAEIVWK